MQTSQLEISPLQSPGKGRILNLFKALSLPGANEMRTQDPSIQQTTGNDSKYYIRPYIDVMNDQGEIVSEQKRIYLGRVGEISKRDAIRKKVEVMAKINKSQFTVQSSITFGEVAAAFVEKRLEVKRCAENTRKLYVSYLNSKILPAFRDKLLGEIDTDMVQALTDKMDADGLSWNTRKAVVKLIRRVYSEVKTYTGEYPTVGINLGRKRLAHPQRKLGTVELIRFLEAMPKDLRLLAEVCLYGALRIGEAMGLQWKHLDFVNGVIMIRQQFSNGEIKDTKTEDSERNVAMGELITELAELFPGKDRMNEFVFSIRMRNGKVTRDSDKVRNMMLNPIAKELGIYSKGFGFHQFRREAVTEYGRNRNMGDMQVQRMVGHSNMQQTYEYARADMEAQENAVRELQAKIRSKVVSIRKPA